MAHRAFRNLPMTHYGRMAALNARINKTNLERKCTKTIRDNASKIFSQLDRVDISNKKVTIFFKPVVKKHFITTISLTTKKCGRELMQTICLNKQTEYAQQLVKRTQNTYRPHWKTDEEQNMFNELVQCMNKYEQM